MEIVSMINFLLNLVILVIIGVPIVIVLAMITQRLPNHRISRAVRFIGGMVALVLTWYILFIYVSLIVQGRLVPWDQWANLRPPPGAWQRGLNDFFNQEPNYYLPAVAIIGLSMGIFLVGMHKAADDSLRSWLPLCYAASHMIFFLVSFPAILLADRLPDLWLSQPRPPVDVGYHRTWPAILVIGVLLGILLWGQNRITALLQAAARSNARDNA